MNNLELKKASLKALHAIVDDKIAVAQTAVSESEESRDSETKSSAGDKHETGRAMVQIEQERNGVQLAKALELKKTLGQLNTNKKLDAATLGSLVFTSQGIYFLAIGIGKVQLETEIVFAISIASPVGQLLFNKKKGDKLVLADKPITILDIC
jgi:hypothetical protein